MKTRSAYARRGSQVATAAALSALILAQSSPVLSVSYYLVTDVPTTLGGTAYTPNQVVRSDSGAYALEAALPVGTEFGAVDRSPDGVWLFAPAHPVTLNPTTFEPRDLISFDGLSFALALDGSAANIPEYAAIDAVFLDGTAAVLSFDVPVILGGVEYSRSDLVGFDAGLFSLFRDAESPGGEVPAYSNLVGAARDSSGSLVVTFDVPTDIGGTEFLPGQLVRCGNPAFSAYFADASWPSSAQLRDLSFVPASGVVPDGAGLPGVPLTVDGSAGNLTLSWGGSCLSADTDYEVYEGTLGQYYSHTQRFCSTGGMMTMTFAQPPGSTYYLVVPRNSVSEGSYGISSSGSERPQGASAYLPQVIAAACP